TGGAAARGGLGGSAAPGRARAAAAPLRDDAADAGALGGAGDAAGLPARALPVPWPDARRQPDRAPDGVAPGRRWRWPADGVRAARLARSVPGIVGNHHR